MAHKTQLMNELALNNQAARAHDTILPVTDNKQVVLVIARRDPVVALVPLLLGDGADGRQHAQHVQVAAAVVGATDGTDLVAFGQFGGDGGGDEGRREEGGVVLGFGGGLGEGGGVGHVGGGMFFVRLELFAGEEKKALRSFVKRLFGSLVKGGRAPG